MRPAIALFCAALFPLPPLAAQTYPEMIGVEVEPMREGSRSRAFVDLGRVFRPWAPITGNDPVPLDANGWPLTDAATVFFDIRPVAAWAGPDQIDDPDAFQPDWSGVYHLSFQGAADLVFADAGRTSARNQRYDPATNTTTAEVVVEPGAGLLVISFTNTRRTPESPLHSGITNVRLIRPGYEPGTGQIFTTEFLSALGPFRTLRFMTMMSTNSADAPFEEPGSRKEWSDRHTPADATQADVGRKRGFAWEYVILLANMAGKDVWINVPASATDDYVRELARLLKRTLHPDLKIYIEHSNEVWNSLFSGYHWNRAAAVAEVSAGDSPLDSGGVNDPAVWARRRHAKRLMEISNLFREVYGEEAINTTVRPVFAHWMIRPNEYRGALAWLESHYGPPSQYFYAVATGHYFGETPREGESIAQIHQEMRRESDQTVNFIRAIQDVAEGFGLRFFAYEGGPDNGGGSRVNVGNRILANRHPGMRDLILRHLRDNWFSQGGGLYMYFTLSGAYSRYGCWGLTEDIVNTNTVKFQAIRELAGPGTPPRINDGGVVDAAGGAARVAPGSFLSIYGENLSRLTMDWNRAIPAWTGGLPVALGGVRVRVNGRDCHISYVSPGQINVLVHPEVSGETATVEVFTDGGEATAQVALEPRVPAFFTYLLNERRFIAALFNGEYTLVAPEGALSVPSRPARAGDYLQLFASGLGPTNPPAPAGLVLRQAYPLADLSRVRVTMGGVEAPVQWAGMTYAGVFQVNVQVPAGVPPGNQPVELEVDGERTQAGVYLAFAGN